MARYMAVDVGTKRIGLAVGDSSVGIVSPLDTIQATGRLPDDLARLLQRADEYGVDEFVVGLPLNMDDSEGPQAKASRRFGDELAAKSGKPVHYHDERLSSFAADQLLREGEFTRGQRKSRQDRVAAHVLLQSFFEQRGCR